MKEWLTLEECVALFREKKRSFAPINFVNLMQHYNIRIKHKWQGLLPQCGLCIAMAQAVNLPEEALFNYDWEHMFAELIKLYNR